MNAHSNPLKTKRVGRDSTHKQLIGIAAVAVMTVAVVALPAIPAGAKNLLSKSQLKAKALSLHDLPTGWTVDTTGNQGVASTGCLKSLGATPKHVTKVKVAYTDGQLPSIAETLESGPGSLARYRAFNHVLATCPKVTLNAAGQPIVATITPVPFVTGVAGSVTYEISFSVQNQTYGLDIVLFRIGSIVGEFGYSNTGPPVPSQARTLLAAALGKVEGRTVTF